MMETCDSCCEETEIVDILPIRSYNPLNPEEVLTEDKIRLCATCREEYFICANCGNAEHQDYIFTYNFDGICKNCFDNLGD